MDESLAKIRHERSKKDFPMLKLADDEYVEVALSRARICLWAILGGTALCVIIILLAFLLVLLGQQMLDEMGKNFLFIILFALLASAVVIGLIALRIYNGNKLFVTNRRVFQLLTTSLVSSSTNVIDLPSIEDASFHQNGILQQLLHYGTLRLATVGDETTYTFKYSDIKPEQMEKISKLITEAKKRLKRKQIAELAEATK